MRLVAERFGISYNALRRHVQNHLPEKPAGGQRQELSELQQILDKLNELVEQIELILDACHNYLLDPEDPTRYYLGPRAEDVEVVFLEEDENGRTHKRRSRLSELLNKTGTSAVAAHWRTADPSRLLLEASRALAGVLLTLSRVAGYAGSPGRKTLNMTQITVYELMSHIMEVLDRHPKVKDEGIRAMQKAME